MTAVVSNGTDTFTPELRIGFESENESQNVEHRVLDGELAVSLVADLPRSGTFDLLFLTSALGEACRVAHTRRATWSIIDDLPAVSFSYVRRGRMSAVQQDDRGLWVLSIGFREVVA